MINPLVTFSIPATLGGLLVMILGLVILWIVVSIPVYTAGKLMTAGRAHFGQAMGATLGGGLVYVIIVWGVSFFLGAILGPIATVFALVLGLAAWLAVYRSSFETNWLSALGIVIVAWAVLVLLDFILVTMFGVPFPEFWPW